MVDEKMHLMIENNVHNCHRSLFVILGENGCHNVITLYDMLVKAKCKSKLSLLWCYNKDNLRFPLDKHQRSTGKQSPVEKQQFNAESQLESFFSSTNIKFCSYGETCSALGQTFDIAVLQDLEDLTPNALAHSVKTVEGGGLIIILGRAMKSLKEQKTLAMLKNPDLLKSRFHKRLISTFETVPSCVILDDQMNFLNEKKLSSHLNSKKNKAPQLTDLHDNNIQANVDEKYGRLSEACHTSDQTKFLSQCLDTLKKNSSYSVVSASSPAGRGKSAVLGLAISGAIDMKYSNIFISSLSFDNVTVVFKYILKGLDALGYEESKHYDIIKYDHPTLNTAILSLNVFKDHPQAVRFIFPGEEMSQLEQAELLVVDEAAAIPLPLLKKLIGPYVVLMATSTEGCGACGKFLYQKMVKEIHDPSSCGSKVTASLFPTSERNTLVKVELNEPLHFAPEDDVEKWINHALCLESSQAKLTSAAPPPDLCRLFYVCRETLFSYKPHAEKFLQQLMSMFQCSKREILPEDLLTMADGEDYHIFCLLPPPDKSGKSSYEILSAILVHKVKQVPWNIVYCGVNQPDPLPKSFNDWTSPSGDKSDFLPIQGIQIVDIVTNPTCRTLGLDYDKQALQLLEDFYCGKSVPLDDKPYLCSTKSGGTRNNEEQDSRFLLQLTEVEPEEIEFILVSFYLTPGQDPEISDPLRRLWKKSGFVPVYITTEKNSAHEHLCMMMKGFGSEKISSYMETNWISFVDNYSTLLASHFKYFPAALALGLLISPFSKQVSGRDLTKDDIDIIMKPQRMKALEKYCHNLGDLHSVVPSINILSEIYFRKHFKIDVEMTAIQQAILLSFGLQHKTINEISKDVGNLPSTQVHAKLNQIIKKLTKYLEAIIEKEVEKTLPVKDVNMTPVSQSLDEELEEAAKKIEEKQAENLKKLKEMDFSEFAIKGSEEDWEKALHTGRKTLVSIKSLKKPSENVELPHPKRKKEEKNKKRKR